MINYWEKWEFLFSGSYVIPSNNLPSYLHLT